MHATKPKVSTRRIAEAEDVPLPLVSLESFISRGPVSPSVVVDWVFEHMRVKVGNVPGEGCPSPGAWGLLKAVQASDARCWEFIKTVWVKRLSRSGMGVGDDSADEDGLDVGVDLIDKLLQIRAQAEGEIVEVAETKQLTGKDLIAGMDPDPWAEAVGKPE